MIKSENKIPRQVKLDLGDGVGPTRINGKPS